MSNAIGLVVSISVWILTFKLFFKNKHGFINSVRRSFWGGWPSSCKLFKSDDKSFDKAFEYFISDSKVLFKFIIWFALGGALGYLVTQLVNL
ncbi:hypothetical protein ACFLW2_04480 [Chloroflexota bacterium]